MVFLATRSTDPDLAPSCSPGPDFTRDQYITFIAVWSRCSMAHGYQYGFRWQTRQQEITYPSAATGTTDVSSGPGCCSAMDPYMALSSSSGLEHTMAPYGSTGHLDQHDSGGRMALRHLDGHQWHHRYLAFLCHLLATDPCCGTLLGPRDGPWQ